MAKMDAKDFAEKWQKNMAGSTAYISKGIDRVTESPMEKAAAKQDKMLNNLNEAVQKGKWKRGLESVTLDEWKKKFKDQGVARIAGGASAAVPKMQRFADQLLPFQDAAKRKIDAMPDTTFEDRLNKSQAWIREMHKFEKK